MIVPVYNVGAYLQQCLQSIASQSYAHLEVIVVDDGSTDDSGKIADEWASRDNRFRVVHQPNGGLSAVYFLIQELLVSFDLPRQNQILFLVFFFQECHVLVEIENVSSVHIK